MSRPPCIVVVAAMLAACAAPAPAPVPWRLPEAATTATAPAPVPPTTPGEPEKSYLVPAAEILAFEVLVNRFSYAFLADREEYEVDGASVERNLQSGWVIDRDPFGVNQLGHPLSGSMYHAFARSTGHGYYGALAYTMVGSAIWEVAGETTRPSLNDQITTGIGGTFLGEGLFRAATWLLDSRPRPGTALTLAATGLSPATAFNRWLFGDRFREGLPSGEPAVSTSVSLGARTHTLLHGQGSSTVDRRTDALAHVTFEYGLPGKSGYRHERPFDHFTFELAASTEPDSVFERVLARGLLLGSNYAAGPDGDGIYGLYGSYDYFSPGVYRVASTALSFGTTVQQRLAGNSALQGSVLAGAGFGAAGTVADDIEDRDYHYGAIPQGLLDLRLLLDETAMLRFTGRDYYIAGTGVDDNTGHENIAWLELAVTLRVSGPHALTLQYVQSSREAKYSQADDEDQDVATISLLYTFLGGTRLAQVR